MAVLREKMVGMDPDLILNMDEAALFYHLAPTKSYVLEFDARGTRGTALQSAKDRITIIMCMNATGSFKNIAVIGRAAQPVCFRGAPQMPIRYYRQKKRGRTRPCTPGGFRACEPIGGRSRSVRAFS